MKLKDISIGQKVYIKKSHTSHYNSSIPFTVHNIIKRKCKPVKIDLGNNIIIALNELSEKNCNEMTCGKCIYHHP